MNYLRRKTSTVNIGNVKLGSDYPIRLQSMTSTSTMDTEGSVAQCQRICDAGADIVRLTTQGVREAENIGEIRSQLHNMGYTTPLVADIHFNPRAAFAAAEVTDKVRINPGNFVDVARTFKKLHFTDEEYAQEIQKIRDALVPFIALCREKGTAVRLGVNHGSLSDRIMSHYGDTPAGMVESAMEFLRIFVEEKFTDVVISIKSSNTVVMVQTVRLLVQAMDAEDMHFPLHLGVTEAGDGEDGRIKSAVGIGTLLSEGIGDTIRVSLSEDPELEVPVAKKLATYITARADMKPIEGCTHHAEPVEPQRRASQTVANVGGQNKPIVVASTLPSALNDHFIPDYFFSAQGIIEDDKNNYIVPAHLYDSSKSNTSPLFDYTQIEACQSSAAPLKWLSISTDANIESLKFLADDANTIIVLSPAHNNVSGCQEHFIALLNEAGITAPVVLLNNYTDDDNEWIQVKAGADFGTMLLNGYRDGIWLDCPNYNNINDIVRYEFGILQAARLRTSKTEYISCPSCGRTLFDLQKTVQEVKAATSHLSHLKIGIMGCIVNGPGEMADADYGYVGAAAGKISLYKNKECIEKNIPQEEAITKLVELIKANGDWIEP
ncbi:MAG: (E)-4-hydroxy-3-methylbut-2-enyl-diphosphate synthase [Muribaculaceae bacterium]|nr:(E)-4-hydroxy-3-methylbut-2-enyl-diphosphate synthase [Muribaculaceae bacterium]